MGTANRQWEGCQWCRQSEHRMKMLEETEHLFWQDRAERENPGARASMQRLDMEWGSGSWNKEMTWWNFHKVSMYWFFSTVVSKSLVYAVACGPIVNITSTMDWLDFRHNGWVCLGMTYLAKPRWLTDIEKTLGRLYMTVLDFSLLQRVGDCSIFVVASILYLECLKNK